jgi:hypothetical protein
MTPEQPNQINYASLAGSYKGCLLGLMFSSEINQLLDYDADKIEKFKDILEKTILSVESRSLGLTDKTHDCC